MAALPSLLNLIHCIQEYNNHTHTETRNTIYYAEERSQQNYLYIHNLYIMIPHNSNNLQDTEQWFFISWNIKLLKCLRTDNYDDDAVDHDDKTNVQFYVALHFITGN